MLEDFPKTRGFFKFFRSEHGANHGGQESNLRFLGVPVDGSDTLKNHRLDGAKFPRKKWDKTTNREKQVRDF